MQLRAEGIWFRYGEESPWVLKGFGFSVESGERVGIVGPSGCGKSTLGKILAGYIGDFSGNVQIDGEALPKRGFCPVQMIFQHPELAVNPRWRMEKILNECWHPGERMVERMGIENGWLRRYPGELSGGELQRFCIARALSPETRFLICDEITTMLDAISQAQIWEALLGVAEERGCGMVIITHNMALARRVCTRIVQVAGL